MPISNPGTNGLVPPPNAPPSPETGMPFGIVVKDCPEETWHRTVAWFPSCEQLALPYIATSEPDRSDWLARAPDSYYTNFF